MHSCVNVSVHFSHQGIDPVMYLISYLFMNVYNGRNQIEQALTEHVTFFFSSKDFN